MSADTSLMPIPGPVDPVPVPRAAMPRADGKVELVGLPREAIRAAMETAGLEPKQAKLRAKQRAAAVLQAEVEAIELRRLWKMYGRRPFLRSLVPGFGFPLMLAALAIGGFLLGFRQLDDPTEVTLLVVGCALTLGIAVGWFAAWGGAWMKGFWTGVKAVELPKPIN